MFFSYEKYLPCIRIINNAWRDGRVVDRMVLKTVD